MHKGNKESLKNRIMSAEEEEGGESKSVEVAEPVNSLTAAGRLRKSVIGENSGLKGSFLLDPNSKSLFC